MQRWCFVQIKKVRNTEFCLCRCILKETIFYSSIYPEPIACIFIGCLTNHSPISQLDRNVKVFNMFLFPQSISKCFYYTHFYTQNWSLRYLEISKLKVTSSHEIFIDIFSYIIDIYCTIQEINNYLSYYSKLSIRSLQRLYDYKYILKLV